MAIFGRNQDRKPSRAAVELLAPMSKPAPAIVSPWQPQDALQTWAVDEALAGLLEGRPDALTRETALKIPGIKRAHGIVCTTLASIPLYMMRDDQRASKQPEWLTNSRTGVSPYHRLFGMASDLFFNGWACLGFTADHTDALHIPYGMWSVNQVTGQIEIPDSHASLIPTEYTAHLVAIPLGFGENGILTDAADTLRAARKIEEAYQNRLDNPIPLTVLSVDGKVWDGWSKDEKRDFLSQWNKSRKATSTAAKPSYVDVAIPGATIGSDLYETGRNAVRLDIANHVSLPASILEGVRQGGSGGGTEMRYTGVQNGNTANELWKFGLARRMLLAIEGRLSLDDIVPAGMSIRGDLTSEFANPDEPTNPTSED